jgi:hypothetical protein
MTIQTDIIESHAAGTPPVFKDSGGVEIVQGCTAWVNFNGTGTVAIRDSFNVSSVVDTGIGLYTINFATAMGNANYAVSGTGADAVGLLIVSTSLLGTSSVNIRMTDTAVTGDNPTVCVSIHGGK